MNVRFRIVQLELHPITGVWVPLVALASNGGALVVVAAPEPLLEPGALRLLQETMLPLVVDFDALPVCMGPQVLLSAPQQAPCSIEVVGAWLAGLLRCPTGYSRGRMPPSIRRLNDAQRAAAEAQAEAYEGPIWTVRSAKCPADGTGTGLLLEGENLVTGFEFSWSLEHLDHLRLYDFRWCTWHDGALESFERLRGRCPSRG